MTTAAFSYEVPTDSNRRALGILAVVAFGVLAAAAMLSCAHSAPRQPEPPTRETVSACLWSARSCAEVQRCAPDVACTEMTEAQARQEGLIQ